MNENGEIEEHSSNLDDSKVSDKIRAVFKGSGERADKMINRFTRAADGVTMTRVFKKVADTPEFVLSEDSDMYSVLKEKEKTDDDSKESEQ